MEDKQQRILDYVAQHGEQIIEDLKQLVQAESPSDRKDLVDACGQKIRQLVKELPAGTAGRPHDVHPGAGRRADLDLGPL